MFYCEGDNRGRLRRVMASEGLKEMHFSFDFSGSKVLVNI